MTVRYEYKAPCCGHEYAEQRGATEPMFFPTCNKCAGADYELIKETKLAEEIEVQAVPEIVEVIEPEVAEIAAPEEASE